MPGVPALRVLTLGRCRRREAALRLFLALELPDDVRASLARCADARLGGRPGVARVAPESLHVTLRFLGAPAAPSTDGAPSTASARPPLPDEATCVRRITAALSRALADLAPWETVVEGLGAFPSLARPRVLWAGVRDAAVEGRGHPLRNLAASVDAALRAGSVDVPAGAGDDGPEQPLGFPVRDRSFRPHVTLARLARPWKGRSRGRSAHASSALSGWALPADAPSFGVLPVRSVTLFSSRLLPQGARHEARVRVPLGTPSCP